MGPRARRLYNTGMDPVVEARVGVPEFDGVPGPDQRAVRVVVADDTDGVRDLVCLLLDLEPDFTVVGQARNGAEAIEVVAGMEPDLVLLDVAMPVLDGLSALPRVRAAAPAARVVVFTGSCERSLAREVSALGADALVEKSLATGPLVERLREVCHRPPRPVTTRR
jgi:DNA-binding NarL/FixJ family response regulator